MKSRIAACVSRGRSSCGTCPQSSSRWRAAGSARSTCFMKPIGTSVSWRPQTNSESDSSVGETGPEAVVAVGLVEVDVARRGIEGGAPARGEVGAQELVHAGRRPAVVRAGHEPANGALHDRARHRAEAVRARGAAGARAAPSGGRAARPAPGSAAPGRARARARRGRPRSPRARPCCCPPASAPLEPERVHRVEHAAREPGRVVGRADRLVGLAEAGQVHRHHAVVAGQRGDGGKEGRLGARPRPWMQSSVRRPVPADRIDTRPLRVRSVS